MSGRIVEAQDLYPDEEPVWKIGQLLRTRGLPDLTGAGRVLSKLSPGPLVTSPETLAA